MPLIFPHEINASCRRVYRAAQLALLLLVVLFLLPSAPISGFPARVAAGTTPQVTSGLAGHLAAGPAAVFNPPCFPINSGPNNSACVSVQYPTDPQIIPTGSSRVSSVLPNTTQTIHLVVKAHNRIDYWLLPASYGLKAPIFLNLSATLWNGDPWYSSIDDSIWHSANPRIWWTFLGFESTNLSFPYWYSLVINATNGRTQLFYPGAVVTWDVVVTQNISNRFIYYEGPRLQYTYAGAWPYSPVPSSPVYGGKNASQADLIGSLFPTAPNWNDSVIVTLKLTPIDTTTRVVLGRAWADFTETSTNGTIIFQTTFYFPTPASNNSFLTIPASYDQVAGATTTLVVTAFDASPLRDEIILPPLGYTVSGNGSFASGQFDNDLSLTTNPAQVITAPSGTAQILPGQAVTVVLTSRNANTAISAAQLRYTFHSNLTGGSVLTITPLFRVSSIEFVGYVQPLPIGIAVNFTVLAWDFNQFLEISDPYSFTTMTFDQLEVPVPTNLTFFYVLVYDNSTNTWVSDATVAVVGPGGFYNSLGRTTFGIGYPNSTTNSFYPLLLPVNVSYRVGVAAPGFAPEGSRTGTAIFINITATNPMTASRTLLRGPNYLVAQRGDILYFWLNAAAPAATTAPQLPLSTALLIGSVGLATTVAATIPLFYWWREIKKRREAEERRITL